MRDILYRFSRPFRILVIAIAMVITGIAGPASVPVDVRSEEEIEPTGEGSTTATEKPRRFIPGLILSAKQIEKYQKIEGKGWREVFGELAAEFKGERPLQEEEAGNLKAKMETSQSAMRLFPYRRRKKTGDGSVDE